MDTSTPDLAIAERIVSRIADELKIRPAQVNATVDLFDGGATVPFVARYRKEVTGGLDDTQLRTLEERLVYLRELEARRTVVRDSIASQGKLDPALAAAIDAADTKQRLEDLYLPYKPHRRTRGEIARAAGLEPLADALLADPSLDPQLEAAKYLKPADEKGEHGVADVKAALDGARDILAERFAQAADVLEALRERMWNEGLIASKLIEGKADEGAKFRDYFDHAEPIAKIPAHRALALFRGRQQGVLSLRLRLSDAQEEQVPHPNVVRLADMVGLAESLRLGGSTKPAVAARKAPVVRAPAVAPESAAASETAAASELPTAPALETPQESVPSQESADSKEPEIAAERTPGEATLASLEPAALQEAGGAQEPAAPSQPAAASTSSSTASGTDAHAWLAELCRWTWRVKLLPHIETELFARLRQTAETDSIRVFGANLKDLLLAPPAGRRVVMGLDPGVRTGVKVAVVDATGKLVETATIYPHEPKRDWDGSKATLSEIVARHDVELIAIGNGTASRDTERLVAELIPALSTEPKPRKIVVSEAGASVYSASALAAKEFPELDVSLRGAVSIARRLQDPLAELVKIEPKAIGVGQYQHDVNQRALAKQLDAVVEDCVNAVGVDLNTASAALLARVSGLSSSVAQRIVEHRDVNGRFPSRLALMRVPSFGERTFEQAAGFLRVLDGDNPLDASAVHPEAYGVVQRILERTGSDAAGIVGNRAVLKGLSAGDFVDERFGEPTVRDILGELEKPGRDPRGEFVTAAFQEGVNSPADLKVGMKLQGVVTNVANFGAFVDVGVHQDGLVHVSELADRFVKDPREVVKAGQVVNVEVMEVDLPRKRIALSMRRGGARGEEGARGGARRPDENRPRREGGRSEGQARRAEGQARRAEGTEERKPQGRPGGAGGRPDGRPDAGGKRFGSRPEGGTGRSDGGRPDRGPRADGGPSQRGAGGSGGDRSGGGPRGGPRSSDGQGQNRGGRGARDGAPSTAMADALAKALRR